MPRGEIQSMDFQIIAAGKSQRELNELYAEISKAISAALTEAPNKEKLIFRSCQSSLTNARLFREKAIEKDVWRIISLTPLKPNSIF